MSAWLEEGVHCSKCGTDVNIQKCPFCQDDPNVISYQPPFCGRCILDHFQEKHQEGIHVL